jgi:agmatinase
VKDDKVDNLAGYNPDGVGVRNGHFIGLPFGQADAEVVLLSVPWDVTTSYRAGTHSGPEAILQASAQLDLWDGRWPEMWRRGIYMRPSPADWLARNATYRARAEEVIAFLESGGVVEQSAHMSALLEGVNTACDELNAWVETQCEAVLARGAVVGVVGGEHSVPLGLLRALARRHENFGVLHLDAHMDLRVAYEGFRFSHASIMYNVLLLPQMSSLVQVGVRDYCGAEHELAASDTRVKVFTDSTMAHALFNGTTWAELVGQMLAVLPEKVYVSFDIDGLSPENCPNTGTPVPGGLSYPQAMYLLESLAVAGKKVIGFDLCETAGLPHEWDASVGARVVYKLALLALSTRS